MQISDIEIEVTTIESDYEPNKYECSICKQKIEIDKGATPHKLDYCLREMLKMIKLLAEELLKIRGK